jgi:hypothetical protein
MDFNPADFAVTPGAMSAPEEDEDINAQLSAIPGLGGAYKNLLAVRTKRQQENADAAAKAWADYKNTMVSERVGPTKLERIASALTAFGRPTANGNFFEALSNANQNMQETGAAVAAAERERKQTLAKLAFQQAQALAQQKEAGAADIENLQLQTLKQAGKSVSIEPRTKDQLYTFLAAKKARGEPLTSGENEVWSALNPERTADIVAGIQSKLARGMPLSPGEREILKRKDPAWMHRAPKAGKTEGLSAAAAAADKMGITITGGR